MYTEDVWEQIDVDTLLKFIQIAFYGSGICVAWLTYLSAKRGLLNTVNTEYQKRVIERLAEVSKTLWDEFDTSGDSLFYRFTTEMRERARKINQLWQANDPFESYEARALLGTHIELLDHLWTLIVKWESDPFLPAHIRHEICASLRDRAEAVRKVAWAHLHDHLNGLRDGTISPSEESAHRLRSAVLDHLEEAGYALIPTQEELIRLRNLVQAHLQSYDPLRRERPPRRIAKLLRFRSP